MPFKQLLTQTAELYERTDSKIRRCIDYSFYLPSHRFRFQWYFHSGVLKFNINFAVERVLPRSFQVYAPEGATCRLQSTECNSDEAQESSIR